MKQVFGRKFFPEKKASAVITANGVEMEFGRINREDRKQLLEDAAAGSYDENYGGRGRVPSDVAKQLLATRNF
jgi:hypothetical protein